VALTGGAFTGADQAALRRLKSTPDADVEAPPEYATSTA
jgi:hypothetical protein